MRLPEGAALPGRVGRVGSAAGAAAEQGRDRHYQSVYRGAVMTIPIPVGSQPHLNPHGSGIDCAWPYSGWLSAYNFDADGMPQIMECDSLDGHHRWRRAGELWELIPEEVEHE